MHAENWNMQTAKTADKKKKDCPSYTVSCVDVCSPCDEEPGHLTVASPGCTVQRSIPILELTQRRVQYQDKEENAQLHGQLY